MKKINSSLRVTEIDTVSDVIVRLYKDASSDESGAAAKDLNLAAIMADVENLSAALTTAIKSDRATSTLDEADIARDKVIRSLGDALNGYAAIPVAAKKSAAQNLLAVYSKYGKQIASKNYAEESSLIESMIEDFGAENLKEDVASLDGIKELISSLRAAQDSFNKANDEYTAWKTGKGGNASEVKKSLTDALNTRLVPYLSAVASLDGYRDFVSKVDAEIEKANSAVKTRGSAKKADK